MLRPPEYISYRDKTMITIFSCPKAFKGNIDIIQRNAIQSWRLLDPSLEIILFGNEKGTAEIAQTVKARHIPEITSTEYGTPLISDIFEKAQKMAKFEILCYINSDIIMIPDLLHAIDQIRQNFPFFLIVGRRWDMDINKKINFNSNWDNKLKECIHQKGKLHPNWGMDYFVFKKGSIDDIPPFAIGRPGWDNWMIFFARNHHIPVIDATTEVIAIHQNHDYYHVPQGDGQTYHGPESQQNRILLGSTINCTTDDANYLFTQTGPRFALKNELLFNLKKIRNFLKNYQKKFKTHLR